MKNELFVIFGGHVKERGRKALRPVRRLNREEPNLNILKESPCLRCNLYVETTICPYAKKGCSKIHEFQEVAAVHCTLYKDQDIFSILKI